MSSRRLTGRHFCLHAGRVAMLLAVLALIRCHHAESLKESAPAAPPLEQVRSFFPAAASVARRDPEGWHAVRGADQTRLGSVVQTSPESDQIIGFSGPTNVMIAFGTDDRVLGIDVISSGDTRDHLRQVLASEAFMTSLDGMTRRQAATSRRTDGVSGATLTSLAIRQSIVQRLGGDTAMSLKFPEPPTVSDVADQFAAAALLTQPAVGSAFWTVWDSGGRRIGTVLRTSPVADNIVGYQGPTDTLICLRPDWRISGIAIASSYDNEPYVGYVRQDGYFKSLFTDRSLSELAALDMESSGIEGVSGATMTSLAVTEGMLRAAQEAQRHPPEDVARAADDFRIGIHDVGTLLVIALAIAIGMTRLRGNRPLRITFQLVLILYLGWIAGNLLSQAMLVGWAQHGVPWKSALGLAMLCGTALVIPIISRRNLYCTHLCPHGALQQLIRRRVTRKSLRLTARARQLLSMVPALLLLWCVIVAFVSLGFSLVDIEPFDAYLYPVAGWATVTVAIVGLVISLFVPMAYCRYGCPTGAVLEFLRFNAASDRWTSRDWVAVACTALAAMLYLVH